jgi:hypothetical protein
MTFTPLRYAGLAVVALMVVGGLGTWATADPPNFGSVNGGDRDGLIVIICAVVLALGVVVARRSLAIVGVLAAAIATATAIYDVQDVQGTDGVSVGWGLWLAVVASVVAIGVAVLLVRAARSSPGAPPPGAPPPGAPPA